MADVKFATVNADINPLAITNIAAPVGFGTPKAAIFICNDVAALNTMEAAAAHMSIGFTDGKVSGTTVGSGYTAGIASSNNNTKTDEESASSYTLVGRMPRINNDNTRFGLRFIKWLSVGVDGIDGVQVDWPFGNSTTVWAAVTFIGGADVANVSTGEFPLPGNPTPFPISLGYEPSAVFCISNNRSIVGDYSSGGFLSFGAAVNKDGTPQASTTYRANNNISGGAQTMARVSSTSVAEGLFSDGVLYYSVEAGFDSDGLVFTQTTGTAAQIVFYLALQLTGNADVDVIDTSIPSTGDYVESSLAYQPTYAFISGNYNTQAYDSTSTSSTTSHFYTVLDDIALYTSNFVSEAAAATTVVGNALFESLAINSWARDSGLVVQSTSHTLQSGGWSIPLSINPANAIPCWAFTLGESAATGVTFDGPDIVAQSGTENTLFSFDENGEGNVASRFTGATSYALSPSSDPLPTGLSVNPTTGNIEGTPTEVATSNIIIRGSQ